MAGDVFLCRSEAIAAPMTTGVLRPRARAPPQAELWFDDAS